MAGGAEDDGHDAGLLPLPMPMPLPLPMPTPRPLPTPSSAGDDDLLLDWDRVEENWLQQIALARAKEDQELHHEYDEEEALLHAELDAAVCEHNRRMEAVLQARVLVDEKQADLEWLLDEFRQRRKALQDQRAADDLRVRAWIDKGRRLLMEEARRRRRRPPPQTWVPNDEAPALRERTNGVSSVSGVSGVSGGPSKVVAIRTQGANGTHLTVSRPPLPSPADLADGCADLGLSKAPPATSGAAAAAAAAAAQNALSGRGPPKGALVIAADGDTVGTLHPIPPDNHWVQSLLDREIVRPVEIRLGRKFTQANLNALYESRDQKRTKWLSFMIQATGELQDRACHTCAKGQGLFSLCVIVGGPDFPRCGNCEWNKHGCHGAAGRHGSRLAAAAAADAASPASFSSSPNQPKPVCAPSGPTPPPPPPPPPALLGPGQKAQSAASGTLGAVAGAGAGANAVAVRSTGKPSQASGALAKAAGGRRLSRAQDPSPPDATTTTTTPAQQLQPFLMRDLTPATRLDEITLSILSLKDDGMIFLEPELMHGVPLRKISPDHAYWEPDWKPLEDAVQKKLDEWVAKLEALKANPEDTLTEKERTAIFQAGRQVNRGRATLKFLSSSDFHPYQIVAKKWITPSLAHYDTLFRMVATLEELAKFHLDVTPLQWLRQRLYEIQCEKQADFKLERVIAKLYHDPKLAHLRSKNGFGNIGRPSVAARPRNGDGAAGSTAGSTKKTAGEKRKEPPMASESATSTPTKRPGRQHKAQGGEPRTSLKREAVETAAAAAAAAAAAPTAAASAAAAAVPTAAASAASAASAKPAGKSAASAAAAAARTRVATNHAYNRNRKAASAKKRDAASVAPSIAASSATDVAAEDDDLYYSGYTSTDSLTKDTVVKKDWRVHQVKTKLLTSNAATTQYWHWVDEKHAHKTSGPGGPQDFDAMFEHQVLKETEPTTSWGVFKEPIDFHLRLRELTTVTYAPDSQKVVIGTRPTDGATERRGNVLAEFKRERTKRRFVSFMRKKGVEVLRGERQAIEDEWDCTQSELMPGNESE